MKLTWLGHACFRAEADGYSIVLDPYADGVVPGLRPLRTAANEALCSHAHNDHGAAALVRIVPADAPSPFRVTAIATKHDEQDGALRGDNTIHVLEADGIRVAHLGDLGHMLTNEQIAAIGRVDALMIPVGGHYTIDAKTAKAVVDALRPRVTLPMHYRSDAFGYDVIGTLDEYLRLVTDAVRHDTDAIEIGANTPAQTAILTYR